MGLLAAVGQRFLSLSCRDERWPALPERKVGRSSPQRCHRFLLKHRLGPVLRRETNLRHIWFGGGIVDHGDQAAAARRSVGPAVPIHPAAAAVSIWRTRT